MRVSDRVFLGVRRRCLRSERGIVLLRFLRWSLPIVAPFTPERADIAPERARAFVAVETRPSTIPGAGHGLFAMEPLEAAVTIGEYAGNIVPSVFKVWRLRDKDYLAQTDDPAICIDSAGRPEVMMRYLCHHPDPAKRNVQFINEGPLKFVRTTCAIEPGKELFTDYGDAFWRVRGIVPRGT